MNFIRDRDYKKKITFELVADSFADADRRGQNLQELLDATLIDVYPIIL